MSREDRTWRNSKCIDPKVHNLRHSKIRVFSSTGSPVKMEECSRQERRATQRYTSSDTLAGPQGRLNGIIPIWKGPYYVINQTGHHLRSFQRPATAFSMNLSASVKCVDDKAPRMMQHECVQLAHAGQIYHHKSQKNFIEERHCESRGNMWCFITTIFDKYDN